MCPTPRIRVKIGNLPLLSIRKGDTRGATSRLMDFFCSYFAPEI
jgi:hypothetical protein